MHPTPTEDELTAIREREAKATSRPLEVRPLRKKGRSLERPSRIKPRQGLEPRTYGLQFADVQGESDAATGS